MGLYNKKLGDQQKYKYGKISEKIQRRNWSFTG
jgi:hypothetical protein